MTIPAWVDEHKAAMHDKRLGRRLGRPPWKQEEITELTRLWTIDGHTCGEIARTMKKTRNAVIGKIHRLGLMQANVARPAPSKRRHRAKSALDFRAACHDNFAAANIRNRQHRAIEAGDGLMIDLPPDQSPHAVTLIDAKDNQCRWPLGENGAFLFCGAEIVEGLPYCPRHCRLAYRRHQQSSAPVYYYRP